MIPINEYVNTLVNARRYEIVEEKKLFGGLFDKKKKTVKNQTQNKDEPYTQSQYNNAVSWLKYYIEEESYKEPCDKLDARGLAYCNISFLEFRSHFNKIKNTKDGLKYSSHDERGLSGVLDNYEEGTSAYELFTKNEFYYLYSGGSPFFYYFPKLQKFLITYHDDDEITVSDLLSYDEIIKIGMEEYTLKEERNSTDKLHNQYVRAYIAADKNLGYYRLSPKPEN